MYDDETQSTSTPFCTSVLPPTFPNLNYSSYSRRHPTGARGQPLVYLTHHFIVGLDRSVLYGNTGLLPRPLLQLLHQQQLH